MKGKLEIRKCVICGNEFEVNLSRSYHTKSRRGKNCITCSSECSKFYNRNNGKHTFPLALFILLVALFCVMLPAICSAAEYLPHKQSTDFNFILDGGNATNCNITYIQFPNGTILTYNSNMSRSSTTFNYTVPATVLNSIGATCFHATCFDESATPQYEDGSVCREVSPSGTNLSTSQSIIYFVFVIISMVLFVLCFYYAVKLEWRNQRDEDGFVINVSDTKYFKILAITGCYLLLLFISGMMGTIMANYVPELGVHRVFEMFYMILLAFIYPIMVVSAVTMLVVFVTNKKLVKALERGIPIK